MSLPQTLALAVPMPHIRDTQTKGTIMVRPKVWLFDNGHITEDKVNARGRLAANLVALIQDAVNNGAQIDGYAPNNGTAAPVKVSGNSKPAKPKANKVSTGNPGKDVADIGEPTRPETYWQAHSTLDGKRVSVGMRTVCNNCGNSLTYCLCKVPVVMLDHKDTRGMVIFSPKS